MSTPTELASAVEQPFRLWPALRDAVRGTQQDFTAGPIGRALLLLAVPMVLETAMESVFAVVDIFFVSRLGSEAVATVGLTESMLTLIYTVALGLSIGVTAMVARRIGEKDPDGAARTAVQAILLGIVVAAMLGRDPGEPSDLTARADERPRQRSVSNTAEAPDSRSRTRRRDWGCIVKCLDIYCPYV